MAEKRKDVGVVIPVSSDAEGVTDVRAYFPAMMTEGEWAQFHKVLEAMKPALVAQLASVRAAPHPCRVGLSGSCEVHDHTDGPESEGQGS